MSSTELHQAIERGDAARVQQLLAADHALARTPDANGVTPVMKALYHQRRELLPPLVEAARPLDVFEAAATGDGARVTELVAADPALATAWSRDGGTALHFAAFFGRPAAAKALLAAGADPSRHAPAFGNVAPLHSAVAARSHEIVAMLLDAGADPNARQARGYTPLHGTAFHGLADTAELLIARGADPALVDETGVDAASLAEKAGHPEFANRLRARR